MIKAKIIYTKKDKKILLRFFTIISIIICIIFDYKDNYKDGGYKKYRQDNLTYMHQR